GDRARASDRHVGRATRAAPRTGAPTPRGRHRSGGAVRRRRPGRRAHRAGAAWSGRMTVTTERRGHVLVITLDRPEARNAINLETSRALADAVELLNTDGELRVGVLTGTGPAFCAGQDLKAL